MQIDYGYWLMMQPFVAAGTLSTYRGLNRLPFHSPLDRGERPELDLAFDRYLDLQESRRLYVDLEAADGAAAALSDAGLPSEVIRIRLTFVPDVRSMQAEASARQRLGKVLDQIEEFSVQEPIVLPSSFRSAGYDVSFPLPNFHSLLMNHGRGQETEWLPMDGVNEFGLMGDSAQAEGLVAQANAGKLNWAPYCAFEIQLRG
jgi:hypothetical protein